MNPSLQKKQTKYLVNKYGSNVKGSEDQGADFENSSDYKKKLSESDDDHDDNGHNSSDASGAENETEAGKLEASFLNAYFEI